MLFDDDRPHPMIAGFSGQFHAVPVAGDVIGADVDVNVDSALQEVYDSVQWLLRSFREQTAFSNSPPAEARVCHRFASGAGA